jgi:hypothetical protein
VRRLSSSGWGPRGGGRGEGVRGERGGEGGGEGVIPHPPASLGQCPSHPPRDPHTHHHTHICAAPAPKGAYAPSPTEVFSLTPRPNFVHPPLLTPPPPPSPSSLPLPLSALTLPTHTPLPHSRRKYGHYCYKHNTSTTLAWKNSDEAFFANNPWKATRPAHLMTIYGSDENKVQQGFCPVSSQCWLGFSDQYVPSRVLMKRQCD